MLYLILSYLPSIICAVHVIRGGREMYWLFIFVIAPLLGPLIYFVAILAPELAAGRTVRQLGKQAAKAIDPEREYRLAKTALEDTPSVAARTRLAAAALALGRASEAEPLYRDALVGQFADDPALLLNHAQTLLELARWQDALDQLGKLPPRNDQTPAVALAFARAYEGLGRFQEADAPYRFAADRMPGLEAAARYVACMAKAGRKEDAHTGLAEIERRFEKIPAHFKAEARRWRNFAASALS